MKSRLHSSWVVLVVGVYRCVWMLLRDENNVWVLCKGQAMLKRRGDKAMGEIGGDPTTALSSLVKSSVGLPYNRQTSHR